MTNDGDCGYAVYDMSVGGEIRRVAEVQAATYREALREARRLLPDGPGELRRGGQVICRFGRAQPFMLRN